MPPQRRAAAAVAAGIWLAAVAVLYLPAATAVAAAAAAAPQSQEPWTLPLPDGSQPEGVAAGAEHDLWVACLSGAIIHVDLRTNTTAVVHKEHGVHLSGVKFCRAQNALFVAGTLSGKGYVYHLAKHAAPAPSGAGAAGWRYSVVSREVLDFGLPGQAYINDVTLTPERAYFTNSLKPLLYWVPRHHHQPASSSSSSSSGAAGVAGVAGGQLTAAAAAKRPIGRVRTGHFFDTKVGQFRANGIATYASKPHKDVLLVANTHTGNLYRVVVSKDQAAAAASKKAASAAAAAHAAAAADAAAAKVSVAANSRAAAATKLSASGSPWQWTSMLAEGVTAKLGGGGGAHAGGVQDAEVTELFLPSIPGPISKRLLVDGLWVQRNATVFVADNYNSRIWGVDVRGGLEHASVSCSWQGDALQVPTTLAMQDGRLWWVNAHLDSCFPFLPCPSHRFELRSVAPDSCRPWQPA